MNKVILVPITLVLALIFSQYLWNDSNLVYGLDDAYIHMGVAKNCALHNNWGINSDEVVSATSSFLYPAILCLVYKVNVSDIVPLLINLISLIGIIWYTQKEYRLTLDKILAFLFLGFIPFIVISGMEHTLQILVSIIFVTEILKEKPSTKLLLLSAFTLPLIRLEGLFLVASGFFFVGKSKTKKLAILIPIVTTICLLFLHYQFTGRLLPTSILAKSPHQITSSLSIFRILFRFPYTLMTNAFFLAQYLITASNISINNNKISKKLGIIYLLSSAIHAQISTIDIRYFAYLQALFVLQFSNIDMKRLYKKIQPIVVLALLPTILMSSLYLVRAVGAPHDIYIQQYSLSQFIKQNNFDSVALNDIGTTSFYSNTKIVDLFGLGNNEILDSKIKGEYSSKLVYNVSKDVSIAAIYDDWFLGYIPNNFKKVGDLTFNFKVISGKDKIGLYEINEDDLVSKVESFDWPDGVFFIRNG
ncbi:MAG: hypothetical protein GOU98_01250 [Candidatus Altiarchaeota archaeon]|nr:hypothetical protein [Candidatus Altiarchaeota archaeon]